MKKPKAWAFRCSAKREKILTPNPFQAVQRRGDPKNHVTSYFPLFYFTLLYYPSMIHSKAYKASNLRGVEMSNSDDFEMAFSFSAATHSRKQDRQSARSSRRRLRRCRSRRRKDPPVGEQRPVSCCRIPSELRRTAVEDAALRQVAESPLDLEEFSERRRPAVFSAELPPPPAVIPPPLRRRLLATPAARVVVSGDGSGGALPAGRYSDGDLGEVYAH